MPGKTTHLHGPYIAGVWVRPLHVDRQQARADLQRVIGRQLDLAQVDAMLERLASIKAWQRLIADNRPSSQDKLRTLRAISRMGPADAAMAYRRCDPYTRAEIDTALRLDLGADISRHPRAENIPRAAECALLRVRGRPRKGGRPRTTGYAETARFCIETWRELGRPLVVWRGKFDHATGRRHSPLMEWAAAIFQILENRAPDPRTLERLLRAEAKRYR